MYIYIYWRDRRKEGRRERVGTKEESGNTRLLIAVSPVPQGSWGWPMTNEGIHYS